MDHSDFFQVSPYHCLDSNSKNNNTKTTICMLILLVCKFLYNDEFLYSFPSQKGAGYHLDLLLVAIIIGICSLLGLPWVVAATVLSVGHVQSLFVESQCTAPGEKTQFLGVRYRKNLMHHGFFSIRNCIVL